MGQVARFDTFLNVCFVSLLIQCDYLLFVPVMILCGLYLTLPIYWLVRFMLERGESSFKHTLPNIEKCCSLSFLRENMLLASVMDTFCLNNTFRICGYEMALGRQMGFWTIIT